MISFLLRKNLGSFCFSLFILIISLPACAQEKSNSKDFKVVYEIVLPESENSGMMSAFLPTESISYVKGHQSRTELSMLMGMSTAIVNNSKTNETYSLISFMGKKYAIDMSNAAASDTTVSTRVVLIDETKNICGYVCKKAEIQFEMDGQKYVSTAWYTPQIKNKAVTLSGKTYKELDGLLMEFDVENNGMRMKMIARSIEFRDVDPTLFLIPKDFKSITMEELGKQLGNFH